MPITTRPKTGIRNRGFAAMSPERQRSIARRGGRAAHQKGTAHQFDSQEAQLAGRKGGRKVSQNRQHMAEIGRKGGESGTKRMVSTLSQNSHTLTTRATSARQLASAGHR